MPGKSLNGLRTVWNHTQGELEGSTTTSYDESELPNYTFNERTGRWVPSCRTLKGTRLRFTREWRVEVVGPEEDDGKLGSKFTFEEEQESRHALQPLSEPLKADTKEREALPQKQDGGMETVESFDYSGTGYTYDEATERLDASQASEVNPRRKQHRKVTFAHPEPDQPRSNRSKEKAASYNDEDPGYTYNSETEQYSAPKRRPKASSFSSSTTKNPPAPSPKQKKRTRLGDKKTAYDFEGAGYTLNPSTGQYDPPKPSSLAHKRRRTGQGDSNANKDNSTVYDFEGSGYTFNEDTQKYEPPKIQPKRRTRNSRAKASKNAALAVPRPGDDAKEEARLFEKEKASHVTERDGSTRASRRVKYEGTPVAPILSQRTSIARDGGDWIEAKASNGPASAVGLVGMDLPREMKPWEAAGVLIEVKKEQEAALEAARLIQEISGSVENVESYEESEGMEGGDSDEESCAYHDDDCWDCILTDSGESEKDIAAEDSSQESDDELEDTWRGYERPLASTIARGGIVLRDPPPNFGFPASSCRSTLPTSRHPEDVLEGARNLMKFVNDAWERNSEEQPELDLGPEAIGIEGQVPHEADEDIRQGADILHQMAHDPGKIVALDQDMAGMRMGA